MNNALFTRLIHFITTTWANECEQWHGSGGGVERVRALVCHADIFALINIAVNARLSFEIDEFRYCKHSFIMACHGIVGLCQKVLCEIYALRLIRDEKCKLSLHRTALPRQITKITTIANASVLSHQCNYDPAGCLFLFHFSYSPHTHPLLALARSAIDYP